MVNIGSRTRAEGHFFAASEDGPDEILRAIDHEIKYLSRFADERRNLRDIDGLDYKVTITVELA